MLMNMIKAGGYVVCLNELANQMVKIRQSRAKDLRRISAKNIVIGAGIGSVLGIALGILFAPKSGRETRSIIADRTSETVKNFVDNVSATKTRIADTAIEKGSRLHEAGTKGLESVKETLKKSDEDKKK